jgi:predicted nucleic acid-binding protein
VGRAAADRFLIDASAAARIHRAGALEAWAPLLRLGRVGLCGPTGAELLRSARSADELDRLADRIDALYAPVPVPPDAWSAVRDLQHKLARAGAHRSAGTLGLLVAATALHHGLTLLHYDHGYETVARHTGLRAQWLAEPGSLD